MIRTAGTQKESMSQEWKNWYKRKLCCIGKTVQRSRVRDVERTKVAKHVDRLPRKAAIVSYKPVP